MPTKTLILEKNAVKEGKIDDLRLNKAVWVDIEKPTEKELHEVARMISLEIKELHGYLRRSQRPMLFNTKNYTGIVFSQPVVTKNYRHTGPVLIFVSHRNNGLITIQHDSSQAIVKVRSYMPERLSEIFKKGVSSFLGILLDEIIDDFFMITDSLSDEIEAIEKKMFEYKESKSVMQNTFTVKKSLIFFQKALVGNREVVLAIEKQLAKFLDNGRLEQFREITGNITQLVEMVTTYRDILTSTIEIHLSAISNNLNVIMKRITSWGALILVPSLIAGIFGMNFKHIPALDSPTGFYFSLILMAVSVTVLIWYFKKKDWF